MLCLVAGLVFQSNRLVVKGHDVQLVATRASKSWVETLYAVDSQGEMKAILSSPSVAALATTEDWGAVQGLKKGLYTSVPDFGFSEVKSKRENGGQVAILTMRRGAATFPKRVHIPDTGRCIRLELDADFGVKRTTLHALLLSYVFTPNGRIAKPDSTFLPGLRMHDENVCGDHFFRSPAAVAQKGNLAALLMPDVDVLAENRPMETVLDLDAKNGVCDGTLMTYGFCAHRLSGHVSYTTDSSMMRSVPGKLHLAADLLLDAQARPYAAYEQATDFAWKKYGHRYLDLVKPQMMPFADYAKVCYPAAFDEHYGNNKIGWFDVEINGYPCGGICSGWGFQQGWVSWQAWFNQIRSAWGLHWWGKKLGNQDWIDKSNKMLNLALAAPMDRGACPTTYQSRERVWRGCLVTPRPDCYYDLTNMAWKGIWMLRWLQFDDCPRKDEIRRQCLEMADLIISKQNTDGSIPTWLDKNLKVVPILDHSAQTALPTWFLAECYKNQVRRAVLSSYPPDFDAMLKAAKFLCDEVVDQQRYYDFETFFSCSPKQCRQTNGLIDDVAMYDPHSLEPPQNTLCMQWTAEALMAISHLGFEPSRSQEPAHCPSAQDKFPGTDPVPARCREQAMKALDMMAMYQNVWPISYRTVAYDYGGFGVQNSDGEYNDARQAQFGCTLSDFGVQLNRQDLFERGVAATRASLTLINHPLHDRYGIYPNPNYPFGIEPENDGHGGSDEQDGRSGFDWGEGSGLVSMAWLLDKYGTTYRGKGWTVLVDGGSKAIDIIKANPPKELRDPPFLFDDWQMKGWSVCGDFPETPTWSTRTNFGTNRDEGFIGTSEDGIGGYDDRYQGEILSPKFVVTKPKIHMLVGGGSLPRTYVELLDENGKQIYVERGQDSERMSERTWDVSKYAGQLLQIRIVDHEIGGWGHINVGRIRCTG